MDLAKKIQDRLEQVKSQREEIVRQLVAHDAVIGELKQLLEPSIYEVIDNANDK